MQRRDLFKFAALGLLASLPLPGLAQSANPDHFTRLPAPIPTAGNGKLEVIEFFSYGCPHCHDFDPLLERWHARLPADVHFIRVPITFGRKQWETYARIYLAIEVLGLTGTLHGKVFDAVHKTRVPLHQEPALRDWIAAQGQDGDKFLETMKSFGVQSRLQRASQIAEAYRVNGVPLLAVDGRFLVSGSQAGSFDAMLATVDALLADLRKAGKTG